jgi:DNA-directed RNA polymerase specialized sigma24 family protein
VANDDSIDLETALVGVLALLIAQREEAGDTTPKRRTELVLADAGFSPSQIARLVGKRPDAVRMAIARARKH